MGREVYTKIATPEEKLTAVKQAAQILRGLGYKKISLSILSVRAARILSVAPQTMGKFIGTLDDTVRPELGLKSKKKTNKIRESSLPSDGG